MGLKNKFGAFIGNLSQKSFKMNAVLFAILWIGYIVGSFYLTLLFGMRGWSVLVTWPLSILFYATVCLAVLVSLVFYCFREKKLSLVFYPKIFLWLLLVPQVIYVLVNPFRDCGDYDCQFAPNMLAALLDSGWIIYDIVVWISILVAVLSIVAYIAGAIILSKKLFVSGSFSGVAMPPKLLLQRVKSWMILLVIFIPILGVVGFFAVAQNGMVSTLYATTVCPDARQIELGKEVGICAWPLRQCWAIVDKKERDQCDFGNALDEAFKKLDLSICDKRIKDIGKRDGCYNMIFHKTRDKSICDKIATKETRCSCYSSIAIDEKDPGLCEQCKDSNGWASKYANCYYSIANAKNDSSICGMAKTPVDKCFCYKRMAGIQKDAALCEECNCGQECEDYYADCYEGVAESKDDPAICALIPNPVQIDECYKYVAVWAHNPSACGLITDQMIKDACHRQARLR